MQSFCYGSKTELNPVLLLASFSANHVRAPAILMRIRAAILPIALAFAFSFVGVAKGQSLEPSASIRIDSGSLLSALGFHLVEATVNFQDSLYRVRFYGVALPSGVYHGSGQVYGLKDIAKIVGRYEPTADGRAFVSDAGVEIVVNPPIVVAARGYLYIDYLGSLYARHDQSVQFGPRN